MNYPFMNRLIQNKLPTVTVKVIDRLVMDRKKEQLGVPSTSKARTNSLPRSSTPVKEMSGILDPNVSNISTVSNRNPKPARGKENRERDSDNEIHIEELANALRRSQHYQEEKEKIQQINAQIAELREKLEQEKEEVENSLSALNALSDLERRYRVGTEVDRLTALVDEDLKMHLDQLKTLVNQEREKLELQNLAPITDEEFSEIVAEATASLNMFNMQNDYELAVQLSSFMPALDESLMKCHESTKKCKEIEESIRRLLQRQATLTAMQNDS